MNGSKEDTGKSMKNALYVQYTLGYPALIYPEPAIENDCFMSTGVCSIRVFQVNELQLSELFTNMNTFIIV